MGDLMREVAAEKKRRAGIDILTRLEANAAALPKPWHARVDFEEAAKEIRRLRSELEAERKRK